MRKVANTLWGIVLIILGIICTLNVFEITHIHLFFDGWWTLLIIIPSFIEMIARKNKTWSIIWLIVGIILFLACRDILDFRMIMKLIFPVALILIGLNLIFKASAVFGGIDIIVPENINIKIKSTPIFGGVSKKVNLKYNEQLPTIYINAFCMFGGVSIK